VAALSVVTRRDDLSFVSVSEYALDGSRIEIWAVGEDDDRRFGVWSKRTEPAAQARSRPALPIDAADDRDPVKREAVERMSAFDDDDLVNGGVAQRFEHRREEEQLLG
jgi:hypothetical protein